MRDQENMAVERGVGGRGKVTKDVNVSLGKIPRSHSSWRLTLPGLLTLETHCSGPPPDPSLS